MGDLHRRGGRRRHARLQLLLSSTDRRQLLAEFLGTALLVAVVVGSGIFAEQLSDDTGLQLLENSIATGAALVALDSHVRGRLGAHFNPVVSLVARLRGELTSRQASFFAVAQTVGACAGAVLANVMFEGATVSVSTHERVSTGHLVAEVVATFGL